MVWVARRLGESVIFYISINNYFSGYNDEINKMKNPTHWGVDQAKPCKLILEITCESGGEAQRTKGLILELVMRPYAISRKVYTFYVEKVV